MKLGGSRRTSPRRSCASAASTPRSTSRSGHTLCPRRSSGPRRPSRPRRTRSRGSAGSTCWGTERHDRGASTTSCAVVPAVRATRASPAFYLSLGDDLMRLFKAQMVERVMSMANVPDDGADREQDGHARDRLRPVAGRAAELRDP
ncbi:hypothetical protein [Streptomyces violaceus]|uniref:hypothetical protein n=1 Tax=Streptomyces violaceus TaxID=1936 RepID=UPI003CD07911